MAHHDPNDPDMWAIPDPKDQVRDEAGVVIGIIAEVLDDGDGGGTYGVRLTDDRTVTIAWDGEWVTDSL